MSSSTLWYYHKDARGLGPVEEAEIRRLLKDSEIAADTLVWRDGLSNWTQAQNTELFSDGESSAPLSIPIAPHEPEAAFEEVVSGLPKIAATIVRLPAASRAVALQTAERSYYELALGWGYPEIRAKSLADVVMVALQRAIERSFPRRLNVRTANWKAPEFRLQSVGGHALPPAARCGRKNPKRGGLGTIHAWGLRQLSSRLGDGGAVSYDSRQFGSLPVHNGFRLRLR